MNYNNSLDSFILLNKKKGYTSFQEIGRLRRLLNQKKIGHAGTLDKEAEGLLIVAIGKATKLLKYVVGLDKTYKATFTFGEQRSTDDSAGTTIATYNGIIDINQVIDANTTLSGSIVQTPPNYSAVHVDGKRAYKVALSGEIPAIKPRNVTIYNNTVLYSTDNTLTVRINCSSGTYIRSIARDLGLQTGYFGYMSELLREKIGIHSLADAYTIDDVELNNFKLIEPAQMLNKIPALFIREDSLIKIQHGKILTNTDFYNTSNTDGIYTVLFDNILKAVVIRKDNTYKYDLVF